MKKFLLTYAYVCISVISLFSQNSCIPLGSTDPCSAPTICGTQALDSLCGRTGTPRSSITPCNSCFTIENNNWVSFIALSPNLTLKYNITNCVKNKGIEVIILNNEPCSSPCGIVTCFTPENDIPITIGPLIPGQQYLIMTDGKSGDICDYAIDVIFGEIAGKTLTKPTVLNGINPICVGRTFDFSIPTVFGATIYDWKIASGNATLIQTGDNSFSLAASSPGITRVCVDVSNPCSKTQNCWDVTTNKIVGVNPPPIVLCKGGPDGIDPCSDSYTWGNGTPAVEIKQCTLQSFLSCDSILTVTIIRRPFNIPIKTYYLAQNEPLKIFDYVIPISFPPKGSNSPRDCFMDTLISKINGSNDGTCDSNVRALVYNLGATAKINTINTANECNVFSKTLKGDVAPCFGNVTYQWFNDSMLISNASEVSITKSGFYTLIVTNTYNKPAPNSFTFISKDTAIIYLDNKSDTIVPIISPPVNSVFTNTKAFTLTGSPSGGIFSGPGMIGNRFNPSIAGVGTFYITYEGFNVCPFKGTKKIKVVGLKKKVGNLIGNSDPLFSFSNNNETETKQEIIIKPNPTSNFIEFQANFLTSDSKVKILITNILGQSIIEKEFNIENGTLESQLDVSNLENGTYLMFVFDDENIINAKFLKMK